MYASMYTTYVWCLCQLLCYASQRNRTSLRVLYLTVNITSGSWIFRTLLKKCKSFIFRQKVILQSTASFKSLVTLIFTLWRRDVTWRDATWPARRVCYTFDKELLLQVLKAHSHKLHFIHAASDDTRISTAIGKFQIFCTATVCCCHMQKTQWVWMSLNVGIDEQKDWLIS